MGIRIKVDPLILQIESPNMTLQTRLISLCVRVKWLLSQSSAEYVFTPEELEVLFFVGCKELNLAAVVYSTPDEYFEKIYDCLGREFRRLESRLLPRNPSLDSHNLQEVAMIKRVRVQLATLDNLEKFYLSEWIIERFSVIEHERKQVELAQAPKPITLGVKP